MNNESKIEIQKISLEPPGGILIWLIIIVEVITFGMGLGALISFGNDNAELYSQSAKNIGKTIGFINTIVLLSSGFAMAESLRNYKRNSVKKARNYLSLTILLGVLFTIIKLVEYSQKVELEINLNTNMFYTFYWLITGFHLVHVLFGIVLLLFFEIKIFRNSELKIEDFEATATFWHMCDLIWLMVFPVVYLLYN